MVPWTLKYEGFYLKYIESSYGVTNNSAAVTFTLHGVNSSGGVTNIAQWSHNANTKFSSATINTEIDTDSKYLYISADKESYTGSGFTATLEFLNSSSECNMEV